MNERGAVCWFFYYFTVYRILFPFRSVDDKREGRKGGTRRGGMIGMRTYSLCKAGIYGGQLCDESTGTLYDNP